jgi:Glycosyl hydrolases family 15
LLFLCRARKTGQQRQGSLSGRKTLLIKLFVIFERMHRADAGLLLIPLVGFLPPEDPRIRGTLQAIEERLLIEDEFVMRYESEHAADGLPAGEGAFLACSFWLADNYILQGRYAEARKLFDRLLSRRNDVGLLAEEFDPLCGRMLGNFPQAYSHVGLINCALNLSRQKGPAEERAETAEAPIQRFEADGKSQTTFVSGTRNPLRIGVPAGNRGSLGCGARTRWAR